jgi:hypothetical protein
MTGWQEDIREKLSATVFRRTDEAAVLGAFSRLGASLPDSFIEFFKRYVGPFGSRRTGFELLDVCEGNPTIVTSTLECRSRFGWPEHLVVLTELLGNSVLVLDAINGAVYNVDLEGGERLIGEGKLLPAWGTFQAFIQSYFQ